MVADLARALVALTAGAALSAQEPAPVEDTVARCARAAEVLLGASEPSRVAHGAALAGRAGCRGVAPALRRQLDRWTRSAHAEADHVRLYLLDALIRLEVELPGEEIAPQLEGPFEPLGLILLARDPAAHESLLFATLQRHWQHGDSDLREAAGNLLAETRAGGFAAWLVPRLPLRLHVTVRDYHPEAMGVGTGGAGGSVRVRATALPDTYPPVPRYELTKRAEPFDVLLAPGSEPVYFRRSEDSRRLFTTSAKPSRPVPPGPSALRWLRHMARADPRRSDLSLFRGELVQWRDADAYAAAVRGFRAEVRAGFDRLVGQLVARGALTQSEAEALPFPLRIEVEDRRRDRSTPLPQVGGG